MKRAMMIFGMLVAALAGAMQGWAEEPASESPVREKGPTIQVAFAMDTTGSMGGLIAAAKEKVWAIANQIASGKPRPDVYMGLVPYRDKGDAYVTKVYALTTNLDQMFTDLMTFEANGGGDGPENVNQALSDAIEKLEWSDDDEVVRILYLVGDYPPHNEYKDVPTYDALAKAALEKGIYVNTILCGNNQEAKTVWQEIARLAEGDFLQIAQDGAVRVIDTPYDAELAELNRKLIGTTIIYGAEEVRLRQETLNEVAGAEIGEPESAEGMSALRRGADRAGFSAKTGMASSNDLLSDIDQGKVKLEEVEGENLPEEMQRMTAEEREAYVAERQTLREELMGQIADLSAKRDEHLKEEAAKSAGRGGMGGFSGGVMDSLRRQAGRGGIEY